MDGHEHSDLRTGVRAGLPFALATFVLGISFGVLAQPLMGSLAPIVMSLVVFAGAAQFAALSVLAAGAGPAAAIAAGLLMNARFLPMGLAAGPALARRPPRRVLGGPGGRHAARGRGSPGGPRRGPPPLGRGRAGAPEASPGRADRRHAATGGGLGQRDGRGRPRRR